MRVLSAVLPCRTRRANEWCADMLFNLNNLNNLNKRTVANTMWQSSTALSSLLDMAIYSVELPAGWLPGSRGSLLVSGVHPLGACEQGLLQREGAWRTA